MAEASLQNMRVFVTFSEIYHIDNSILPAIRLRFNVSTRADSGTPLDIILQRAILKTNLRQDASKADLLIGDAHSERLHYRWIANNNTSIDFILPLDHY